MTAIGKESFASFRQARFGIFIHWGLYAAPGGFWQGQTMDYIGEWVQARFRIPGREYAALANGFNPTAFDADEWIRTIKAAGANYIVYTTKHHDGFAMYHSKVSRYNICDATPFGRDPLRELADACAKYGVKLGLYYSQALDWSDPDGADPGPACDKNFGMSWGNDWDYPDLAAKNVTRYFERKALPQLRELMTNYGEIACLWCDCPMVLSVAQSHQLYDLVRELQPNCLINSRLGHGLGDYGSLGDNQQPAGVAEFPLESPNTLNHTWGFKWSDHNWKKPEQVVNDLAALASKDTNYLLNIGPRPDGAFPAAAVDILRAVGEWTARHREALYGAGPTPFVQELPWGYCTTAGNQLFFFLRDWSRKMTVSGIRNRVARVLGATFEQDRDTLTLYLPERPDELLPMLTVVLDGAPVIAPEAMPQNGVLELRPTQGTLVLGRTGLASDGAVRLGAAAEQMTAGEHAALAEDGSLTQWHNPADAIEWEAVFPQGGAYEVALTTVNRMHSQPWVAGREVELRLGEQTLRGELRADRELPGDYYRAAQSTLGRLTVPAGTPVKIVLRTVGLSAPAAAELNLSALRFTRV